MIRLFFSFLLVAAASCYEASLVLDEECLNFTVYPVQYDLRIKPSIYTSEYFFYDCDLVITVIANAPQVRIIELEVKDMDIISVVVFRDRVNIINRNSPFNHDRMNGKLFIYLSEPMLVFKEHKIQYQIRIEFKKVVRYDAPGVFAVKYQDEKGEKYMIVTRLSRNHARYFIPCFTNSRFESVFKFVVIVPHEQGMQVTNTSLVVAKEQSKIDKGNHVVIEYQPSQQVSLNEIGFVVSQFANASMTARDTNDTIVIWSPGSSLPYYYYILKFGQTIMNFIHEYTRTDKRITHGPINIVAVPAFLNGYEISSWSLLTNGDIRLAYVPELTSIRQMETMTFQLTQQLCRIWMGNPGGQPRTYWKEEWFKEGVATYFAYYFLEKYHHNGPSFKRGWPHGFYGLEMKFKAMMIDWHHSTPALVSFNRTLATEIPSRNKELVTMKTASLLWMLENWIGMEKFHAAMIKYINMKKDEHIRYISIDDFLTHLDKETVECANQLFNGSTSSRVLDSWIHQSGYPVINVQVFRDRNPNVILLKQRKFTIMNEFRHDTKYLIPISYVVQHNQDCYNCQQPRFTISTPSYSFGENLNGGWILLNRRASGYYRVNYDVDSWKLIAETLRHQHSTIDELNRAQIVNDVFALYAAGDLDFDLATEVLDYLDKERSHAVWSAAFNGFEFMKFERAACHLTKAVYLEWQEFMRSKVSPIYEVLVDDLEQQPQTRLFRSDVAAAACAARLAPCRVRARRLYAQARENGGGLDPDFRQACYFTVLNESSGALESQNLTRFEEEDRTIAKTKIWDESRLTHMLPKGKNPAKHRPENLTATDSPTLAPLKLQPDSSTTVQTSLMCLILAYLCICTF